MVKEKRGLVIKNGLLINGKREKPFEGALIVENGRIREIRRGREPGLLPEGFPVIDARGAYVTPGFVDIHRHGDWRAFPGNSDDELLNRQGITTVVNGNCGLSVFPAAGIHGDEIRHFLAPVTGRKPVLPETKDADEDLEHYLKALSGIRRTVNTGMLAGNGTIRAYAAGYHVGELSRDEVRTIQKSIEKSLSDGALGISLGLGYAPEFGYDIRGLAEVLEPLKGTDIPVTTHIRSEGDGSYESIEEVIAVAEILGIPLHISHMKCIGRRNWNTGSRRTLELIHRKNAEGMKIDYDLYPYKTGSTQLFHVIPPSFQAGGEDTFLRGLKDPGFRASLTKALKTPSHEFENIVELVGFQNIMVGTLHSEAFHGYDGLPIERIAKARGTDPYDTLYDILEAEDCEVTMLDTIACEEDIIRFYQDPLSSVISDAIYPEGGRLHPRVYAAFPYFLICYVRRMGILPIEEAVYKMTAGPASVLGINRGVIEEGAEADLCVFALDELKAPASFENPGQMCGGFRYVITGGEIVVEHDRWRPESGGAGRIIRR